jgi:hypothetical protein
MPQAFSADHFGSKLAVILHRIWIDGTEFN